MISSLNKIDDFKNLIKSDVVFCSGLKFVDRKFFDELKEIENSKAKSYCCVVWVKRKISKKDCDYLNGMNNVEVK